MPSQFLAARAQITSLDWAGALKYAVVGMAVVMSILALLSVLIVALSKSIIWAERRKKPGTAAEPLPEPAAPPAPYVPQVSLFDTDEETAAVLMAIVAEQSGIPLEHLKFESIKLAEE
ncbi:MAG: OadG family protein [Oscillospiraceae bacterium]|jgi:Na+-transporting methylmalonyl-CoA/oxaloacetate decarboxylase gamma subunit|nr:OadG family protein [Oscillospiraceae bacterium]